MVLFDCGTVPRSSNVVFELVCIDENQRAQKWDENDQEHVEYAKKSMHLENAVSQHKRRYQGRDVVDEAETVAKNMTKDWYESKNA